ncbi:PREDICTED: developmentally-regulated GTP-binding protein 2 [Calidris pugnax]|uniref:developmentally-regulated GTP-binding protein 2 n=1 Tax=Calidris pugnax TaxID=198806 RepID=UPI00071E185A|nr:PREDICTED: developmentally-regulated GTP-binding protein 2 [Calidris pugnax]
MMREAPVSWVLFAADKSFFPSTNGERPAYERKLGRRGTWQDPPPGAGGSVCRCLGRCGWICRAEEGERESDRRRGGRAAPGTPTREHAPVGSPGTLTRPWTPTHPAGDPHPPVDPHPRCWRRAERGWRVAGGGRSGAAGARHRRSREGDGRTDGPGRRFRREKRVGPGERARPAPAMGILEKISEIEKEIAPTEYHLGLLKAKLAKYRAQLLEPSKSSAAKGEGFDVMKSGDARVALIGFPSVGKSTFLSLMTSTASEAASYEFTTLTCIPGVIEYKGANIQLLDLPGIIEGAAQGKGRGRQVIAVARTADVVIMMLDATKGEVQRALLEKELESVGIRLNKSKPNIYFKPKKGGGISFNSTVTLTQCSEKLVQLILHEYKIFNAEVLFREDCSPDEFIDVIVGNRVYMPCLYVYNKIDQISMEEVDRLARRPHSVVISCGMKLNLDYLLEKLWEYLALTCIYTKKRGQRPDFTDAIILRKGASVEHVCHRIHRSLASQFKYALVWGTSTKYSPQRVGLTHMMEHEDVIQIVKK